MCPSSVTNLPNSTWTSSSLFYLALRFLYHFLSVCDNTPPKHLPRLSIKPNTPIVWLLVASTWQWEICKHLFFFVLEIRSSSWQVSCKRHLMSIWLFILVLYLVNNVEYTSLLLSNKIFYLLRQYDSQKELHRSHLVSTKTGKTGWGLRINNLAYSYSLVHFIEKAIKSSVAGDNFSKISARYYVN